MPKKTLTNQANNSANRIASQNLATEMVELSDEALSQVWGGSESCFWETQPIDGGGYYGPIEPIEPFVPFVPVYNPNGDPFTHAP